MEFDIHGPIDSDEKNGIYVFGSHQYALYFWSKALWEKRIRPQAQLIHIDYHTDFLTLCIDIPPTATPDDIRRLIENKQIPNDRFIKPAIAIGLIDNVTFCCYPARHQPTGNFNNFVSPIVLVDNLSNYLNNEEYGSKQDRFFSNINSGNIILDIDLDFFYKPKGRKNLLRPKSEKEIKKEVCAINSLFDYATITTIATSPEMYRKEFRAFVESMFLKYFKVPIDLNKKNEDK